MATLEKDRKQTLCGLKDLSVSRILQLFFSLTFSLPADSPTPSHLLCCVMSSKFTAIKMTNHLHFHNRPLQVFVTENVLFVLLVQTFLYCAVEPVADCVWLWIICYDGWTCLVTSCPDICQSKLSVNRNVEKNEIKCPGRPCSHTQIIIIMIPGRLFVYVCRDLFLMRCCRERATEVWF